MDVDRHQRQQASVAQPVPDHANESTFASQFDWLSLNSGARWLRRGGPLAGLRQGRRRARAGIAHVGRRSVARQVSAASCKAGGIALHTGYVAGVGVEHAFLGNWSAKLEYNYIHFRPQDVLGTVQTCQYSAGFIVATSRLLRHTVIRTCTW